MLQKVTIPHPLSMQRWGVGKQTGGSASPNDTVELGRFVLLKWPDSAPIWVVEAKRGVFCCRSVVIPLVNEETVVFPSRTGTRVETRCVLEFLWGGILFV